MRIIQNWINNCLGQILANIDAKMFIFFLLYDIILVMKVGILWQNIMIKK